jgi:2-oxo-hept-3-ene-1,7-dioate hydratase/2-keto-4-pentenoate hydratase
MSLDEVRRRQIAESLRHAHHTRTPVPRLTGAYPDMDIEDAYRVQEMFVQRRLEEGAQVRGYKVGLTSKPMQALAGSDEPDYSAMTDDLFLPEGTPVELLRATDFVLPAIEVVDFRVTLEPGFGIVDTIADLAACGAAVLGANPRRLDQLDIRRVRGTLTRNGSVEQEGEASAVLGNPVTAVAWLANRLSAFGVTFAPGDVILTGSFVAGIAVAPGDDVHCAFDQGLGSVQVTFT